MTGVRVAGTTVRRPSVLAVGAMVWLASELMFFAGLFASYFTIRAGTAVWPPTGVELPVLRDGIFTIVLVSSSLTMQAAHHAFDHNRRRPGRVWVLVTLFLGVVFLSNQLDEWLTIGFTPSTDAYGSLFFLMTGFHGLHVIIGLLLMVALLIRVAGPGPDPGDAPASAVITYYWHFVDVVWVALYATIFLLR